MPPFDAGQQASAQVTVAIVLAGFAFAGFVLLIDKVKPDEGDTPSRQLYFESMFLLAAAFSIGALAAFFYATSLGLEPWAAYRSIQFAHTLFVLEIFALVVSVGWVLGIHAPYALRLRAWWLTTLIALYAFVRMVAEVFRHELDRQGGSSTGSVVLFAAAGVALPIAFTAVVNMRHNRPAIRTTQAVLRYASGIAIAGAAVSGPQIVFNFRSTTDSLPTTVGLLLMVVVTSMFSWTVVISRPFLRPGESKRHISDTRFTV